MNFSKALGFTAGALLGWSERSSNLGNGEEPADVRAFGLSRNGRKEIDRVNV